MKRTAALIISAALAISALLLDPPPLYAADQITELVQFYADPPPDLDELIVQLEALGPEVLDIGIPVDAPDVVRYLEDRKYVSLSKSDGQANPPDDIETPITHGQLYPGEAGNRAGPRLLAVVCIPRRW